MKESLSVLLNYCRPMAGRFDPSRNFVNLTDDGVLFEVFESSKYENLDDILNHYHEKSFSSDFIDYSGTVLSYQLFAKSTPLMAIRVTQLLKTDHWVLGVRCSHMIADGDTFYQIVQLWSILHRKLELPNPLPCFDQGVLPYEPKKRTRAEVLKEVKERGWVKVDVRKSMWRFTLCALHGVPFQHKVRTKCYSISANGLYNLRLFCEKKLSSTYGKLT